jgi:hypothetical protein
MADEMTRPPFNRPAIVPATFGWEALLKLDGDELEAHYRHCLEELGRQPGMLGEIFKKARAEIQNPEHLNIWLSCILSMWAISAFIIGMIYLLVTGAVFSQVAFELAHPEPVGHFPHVKQMDSISPPQRRHRRLPPDLRYSFSASNPAQRKPISSRWTCVL